MSTVKTERPTSELTREARDKHKRYLLPATIQYYQEPVVLTDGKGLRVRDADGNEYLDFFGGILTVSVGHANERVNAAITAQISRLSHVSSVYPTLPVVELAETLARLAPGDLSQCFLATSGTEADETAVMLAQLFTGSSEVVALRHGYSGRSALAQSLTGHASWRPLPTAVAGVKHAPAPYCYRCPLHLTYPSCGIACAKDIEELIRTTTSGRVAALIAEPIQGVGGFITPPPEYFEIAVSIVRRYGGVFICDEVQTGFGRTGGSFWGIAHWGVVPDILTMAKGIANGLPLGATIARPDIAASLKSLTISTFGGNPVACAAANATIAIIEGEDLPRNAETMGRRLRAGLEELQRRYPRNIGDVRGLGLMQGVELVEDETAGNRTPARALTSRVFEESRRRGLLIGKGGLEGNCFRIAPALNVTAAEVDEALALLGESFQAAGAR
ncbi:MAG TPA: aspartate aminotransferase family protein [Thermoanaerobaculia bacterium]|jgi:4-aminobutyrate aminotransferase-like enzyme|nr:aspartate aminotransferase family protein [Thermoanaerobaculia bacterium]